MSVFRFFPLPSTDTFRFAPLGGILNLAVGSGAQEKEGGTVNVGHGNLCRGRFWDSDFAPSPLVERRLLCRALTVQPHFVPNAMVQDTCCAGLRLGSAQT